MYIGVGTYTERMDDQWRIPRFWSFTSVSREVKRNKATWEPHRKPDNPYWYNHWRAQTLSIQRRRDHRRTALRPGTEAWDFIVAGLNCYWSPETIAGRWHLEFPDRKPLCVATIYRYVRAKLFPDIQTKTHLRRQGGVSHERNQASDGAH